MAGLARRDGQQVAVVTVAAGARCSPTPAAAVEALVGQAEQAGPAEAGPAAEAAPASSVGQVPAKPAEWARVAVPGAGR
ncbi:MAG TPA: hypothetical protein VGL88_12730 [Pseudonocardiaceae bacterium]